MRTAKIHQTTTRDSKQQNTDLHRINGFPRIIKNIIKKSALVSVNMNYKVLIMISTRRNNDTIGIDLIN